MRPCNFHRIHYFPECPVKSFNVKIIVPLGNDVYKTFSKAVWCILNKLFLQRHFFRSQCDFLKVVVPLWQSSFVLEKLIFHIALKTQKKKLFLHMYVSLKIKIEKFSC